MSTQVYFIRHGESEWNRAQEDKNLGEMLHFDHPLNVLGIEQAQELHRRWKQVHLQQVIKNAEASAVAEEAEAKTVPNEDEMKTPAKDLEGTTEIGRYEQGFMKVQV